MKRKNCGIRAMGMAAVLMGIVFLVLGCEVPTGAKVKATPDLHLPLGNPLGKNNNVIGDYLKPDYIQEQMGDMKGMDVYNYKVSTIDGDVDTTGVGTIDGTKVQTYLVHYQLSKMNFSLSFDEDSGITVPTIDIPDDAANVFANPVFAALGKPLYIGNGQLYVVDSSNTNNLIYTSLGLTKVANEDALLNTPTATIELADTEMAKWLTQIKVAGNSAITLSGIGNAAAVELYVPQLGIEGVGGSKYKAGSLTGGILSFSKDGINPPTEAFELFKTSGTEAAKAQSKQVDVYAKITDTSTIPANIVADVDFHWITAEVHPGDNGEFVDYVKGLDLSSLKDTLGSIEFQTVPAYLYVDGLPAASNAKMKLFAYKDVGAGTPSTPIAGDYELIGTVTGGGDPITGANYSTAVSGKLPTLPSKDITSSINFTTVSVPAFNLKDVVNADSASALYYNIDVDSAMVTSGAADPEITVDLVILLPLQLKVEKITSGPDKNTQTIGGQDYLRLNVEALDLDLGDDDLLGRDTNGTSEFGDVTSISMILTDIKNNAIEGLYLGIQPRGADNNPTAPWKAYPLNTAPQVPIDLSQTDIAPPFAPKFDLFVKDDGGILKIKPSPNDGSDDFDFKLTIEASAALDYTIF